MRHTGTTTDLSDLEFVRAFEACELPNESFHHRDHIRLAWIYLKSHGEVEARHRLGDAIRRFAGYHGKSDKYHETVTAAWLRLVASAMDRLPHGASFDDVTISAPELLDKRTIEKFYSAATLAAEAARISWVEPDLQPLP
jgi:hypothetical protein